MQNSVQRGVTLPELLIGLSILAILAGIGAPSFISSAQNARQSASHSSLIGALHLARSESIKRNTNVALCARAASETSMACGNHWKDGWLVFVDDGATANNLDSTEQLLLVGEPLSDGSRATSQGSADGSRTTYIYRKSIRFNPRGTSNWLGGGWIALCDERGRRYAKGIIVSVSGDIRRARKNPQGVMKSPWGTNLKC